MIILERKLQPLNRESIGERVWNRLIVKTAKFATELERGMCTNGLLL